MNSTLKIPFALNKEDGKMYEPEKAEKGSKNFICPCCNEPLVINKGNIKIPYFSHKPDTNCKYAEQTSLHLKAKEILENNPEKYIWVPEIEDFWIESKFVYSKVYIEQKIDEIIPDVILEDKYGNQLLIEITVTHGIDNIKNQKIKDNDLNVLEIDLTTMERDINTEDLTLSIINELSHKYWINDKNISKLFNYVEQNNEYCHIDTSLNIDIINQDNCYKCKHSLFCLNQKNKICKNKLEIPKSIDYKDWINLSNNKSININFKENDIFKNNDYNKYLIYYINKSNGKSEEISFKLPELYCKSENQQVFVENCRKNIINRFVTKLNKPENIRFHEYNLKKIYTLLKYFSKYKFEFWIKNKDEELDIEKKEYRIRDIDLDYGFVIGVNYISKSKILKWRHCDFINWKSFLWNISEFMHIIDFSETWFKTEIFSNEHLKCFYENVIDYDDFMCENNYEVNKTDDLWIDHKRNADKNYDILLRLLK